MNQPFRHIKKVYCIGIGGIGMSSIARYFKQMGKDVSGYDRVDSKHTTALQEEQINIHFEENIDLIEPSFKTDKKNTLVVYTPAVPEENKEMSFFKANGFTVMKRSQVLGEISKKHYTIAVAGTHGKTTISCLIAHILKQAGIPSLAILGGISSDYSTNFWHDESARIMITEADEYDHSFLALQPDISIITSVDADHLDIYHSDNEMIDGYKAFADKTPTNGLLIVNVRDIKIFQDIPVPIITYGIEEGDFSADAIQIKNHQFYFKEKGNDSIEYQMLQPGRYNIENALAAIIVAQQLEIDNAIIQEALATFKGVERRFEYKIPQGRFIYIDDYAHHPAELRAAISATRELYPKAFITGIFQPHLYSRTRDFSDAFAASLSLLDKVLLLPIYPAREKPISGVSSKLILDKIKLKEKKLIDKSNLKNELEQLKEGVLLTLGAGDIGLLTESIKRILSK